MPRLNSHFKNVAFFLYGIDPQSGETTGPHATGAFIGGYTTGDVGKEILNIYAVTCQHAITSGLTIIRINTKDGKSRYIELEPHEWEVSDNGNDIAAIDITDNINDNEDVIYIIPADLIAGKDFIQDVEFGIGEDGFMLGLFAEHPGRDRNLVAARFGNVSLLAEDDVPIEQGNENKRPSHIFDMRSRPGFSGSPVFVYRTPSGDLRNIAYGPAYKAPKSVRIDTRRGDAYIEEDNWTERINDQQNTFIRLLGIHSAQYHDRVKAIKSRDIQSEKDDHISDGDELKMPNSMTVVVPAWEILTLINNQHFTQQRGKRIEKFQKSALTVPEPETTSPDDNSVIVTNLK